jgi:hypothetical protein
MRIFEGDWREGTERRKQTSQDIHLYLHGVGLGDAAGISQKLDLVLTALGVIKTQETQIMASLDELVTAVAAESTIDDSIIALLQSLKAQIGVLSPADQAKVDAAFAAATANAAKIGDAVTANTPATGTP